MIFNPTNILGTILAIIAAFCFNFAVILQKMGLNDIPEVELDTGFKGIINSFKNFFSNKFWVMGFFMGIIGWFPYIISIGLVSILVVSPIISVGLIAFVIAANRILKEKIGLIEIISIGFLILATILLTFAQITEIYIDLISIIIPLLYYLLILIIISVGFFIFSRFTQDSKIEGILLIFTGAILYSLGIVFTNIFTQALSDANINPIFFWEILFGFLWYETHLWVFFSFYLMVIFNLISIIFYQSGLQKTKAILMFPIFNSITLILPIFTGFFIFHQRFDNNLLFFICVVLILLSTVILSRFQAKIENIEKKASFR